MEDLVLVSTPDPPPYAPARQRRRCRRGILVYYQILLVGVSEDRPIYNLQINVGNVVVTGDTNIGKKEGIHKQNQVDTR